MLLKSTLEAWGNPLPKPMRSSTGRWVTGDDFFDRQRELRILEDTLVDGNHVLLGGQRRMGKTSFARKLGRRLEDSGWIFLFADVEGATCADDVIVDIAQAAHPVRKISSKMATFVGRCYRFQSNLLRDWRSARFSEHYILLENRISSEEHRRHTL